jgi:hypothetical protein
MGGEPERPALDVPRRLRDDWTSSGSGRVHRRVAGSHRGLGYNSCVLIWALISLVGIVCLLLAWLAPKWQIRDLDPKEPNQRFLAENEARKTLAQIIGGLAILTGLYFTNATLKVTSDQAALAQRQFGLAQDGQVTDRFTKATDELGNPSVAVRLGALLAFDRLSHDSPSDQWHVITLLTSWIQATSPRFTNNGWCILDRFGTNGDCPVPTPAG